MDVLSTPDAWVVLVGAVAVAELVLAALVGLVWSAWSVVRLVRAVAGARGGEAVAAPTGLSAAAVGAPTRGAD